MTHKTALTETTKLNRAWSAFDFSKVDNQTAEALKSAGEQWHNSGRIIFEQIVLRGNIAEQVFANYKGHYSKWCQKIAHVDLQTAANYRAVARHLGTLDASVAAKFQARALYILARDIMTDEQRRQALEWVQDNNTGETITRELATISLPSTPEYIKAAYTNREMTTAQAYRLIIALNKLQERSPTVYNSVITNKIQHGEVVEYIRESFARWMNGDTHRFDDIAKNNYHFCFTEGRSDYEIPLSSATKETVERYIAWHRYVAFEQAKSKQESEIAANYWQGILKPNKTTPNRSGLVNIEFQLPDQVMRAADLDDFEVVINYKIKKRGNNE